MKAGIHPDNYRVVVFKDMSDGTQFFSRSTAATKDTIEIDGVQYPLIKLEISNTSHPFYTGKSKLVDTRSRTRVTRSTPVSPNSWTPQVVWTNLCLATAIATASNPCEIFQGASMCLPLDILLLIAL